MVRVTTLREALAFLKAWSHWFYVIQKDPKYYPGRLRRKVERPCFGLRICGDVSFAGRKSAWEAGITLWFY